MINDPVERYVSALADEIGEMLPENPRYARRVVAKLQRRTIVASPYSIGFAAAASLLACVGVFMLMQDKQSTANTEPPIKVASADLVKSVVAPDEQLQVRFVSHRTRLCKDELERTWLNENGQTVHITRRPGIGQAVTHEPIERVIPVPQPHGLVPGKYTYRSVIYSTCGVDFYAAPSGDMAYEVRSER